MTENARLFEVTSLFRALMKSITTEWNKRGNIYGLTIPQFKVLYFLDKEGSQNVSQLAELLMITPAAVTGITDKLVVEGFVKRERGEQDRRVVHITLTKSGMAIIEKVKESQKETLDMIFNLLPEEDIQHLRRIFGLMLSNIESNNQNNV